MDPALDLPPPPLATVNRPFGMTDVPGPDDPRRALPSPLFVPPRLGDSPTVASRTYSAPPAQNGLVAANDAAFAAAVNTLFGLNIDPSAAPQNKQDFLNLQVSHLTMDHVRRLFENRDDLAAYFPDVQTKFSGATRFEELQPTDKVFLARTLYTLVRTDLLITEVAYRTLSQAVAHVLRNLFKTSQAAEPVIDTEAQANLNLKTRYALDANSDANEVSLAHVAANASFKEGEVVVVGAQELFEVVAVSQNGPRTITTLHCAETNRTIALCKCSNRDAAIGVSEPEDGRFAPDEVLGEDWTSSAKLSIIAVGGAAPFASRLAAQCFAQDSQEQADAGQEVSLMTYNGLGMTQTDWQRFEADMKKGPAERTFAIHHHTREGDNNHLQNHAHAGYRCDHLNLTLTRTVWARNQDTGKMEGQSARSERKTHLNSELVKVRAAMAGRAYAKATEITSMPGCSQAKLDAILALGINATTELAVWDDRTAETVAGSGGSGIASRKVEILEVLQRTAATPATSDDEAEAPPLRMTAAPSTHAATDAQARAIIEALAEYTELAALTKVELADPVSAPTTTPIDLAKDRELFDALLCNAEYGLQFPHRVWRWEKIAAPEPLELPTVERYEAVLAAHLPRTGATPEER